MTKIRAVSMCNVGYEGYGIDLCSPDGIRWIKSINFTDMSEKLLYVVSYYFLTP